MNNCINYYLFRAVLKACREMITKLTYARFEADFQELNATYQEAALNKYVC